MLLRFFLHLRDHRIPVSLREHLDLLTALKARLVFANLNHFYFLSRLCLVKDEKYFDRFDLAFNSFFSDLEPWDGIFDLEHRSKWLEPLFLMIFPELTEKTLREEMQKALTDYRALVNERDSYQKGTLEESASGHTERDAQSVETADEFSESRNPVSEESSEFTREDAENKEGDSGEGGEDDTDEEGEKGEKGDEGKDGEGKDGERGEGSSDNPAEGVKTNLESESQRSAVKVWVDRQFKDYDPDVELGTRNIKIALRRLRKFARVSAALELDLHDTIHSTARNGGILDIKEVPERHNAVKVLLFLDVGGSMDEHIELCAQLFSAARSEFKHLETFYFHNFIYESVWKNNLWANNLSTSHLSTSNLLIKKDSRLEDRVPMVEILRRYGRDYKVIFVGDAQMARHEIMEIGGSVEHYNSQSGDKWMAELREQFRKVAWLNPVATQDWNDSDTTQLIRRLLDDKMYHLGVDGIDAAMKYLVQ